MNAEEYYKQENYPILDKFDKKALKFDYYDMINFAENYANEQLKLNDVKDCFSKINKIAKSNHINF